MIKICKCMYFAPFNNSFLPFCDSNITDSFLTIQFLTKTMKKLVRNYKKSEKNVPKIRNGQILNTFWPYIFWPKLLKSVQFFYMYYQSFLFNYFLLIFQISIFQWLNCRNLKDELNLCYNGGGVVYVLKS